MFNGVDKDRFNEILRGGDYEQEEKLREERGYGRKGSEKDDFWEFAKKVGYIRHIRNFDEYHFEMPGDIDSELEEELRRLHGYGPKGSDKDDFWEFAKLHGLGHFKNFPMDAYNSYKENGEKEL
ncbi:MAG: hypothetical protein Q7U53_17415 [Anaerolineaceae bacterium]|nr:hypothetical protein [Anaerolineaceae bacterium]